MSTRRNVVIDFGETSVALYSHWDGDDLPAVVAYALHRGRSRWADPPYLARIIFSEIIRDDVDGLIGYGIEPFVTGTTAYMEANDRYDIFIHPGTIAVGDQTYTYEEFVKEYLP